MQEKLGIERMTTELDRLAGIHARLEGRRSALLEQQADIVKRVGIAKGRAAMKKTVEQFVQEIQAEAYSEVTANFSTLLTTLAQEVLPDTKPIDLEMSTERGLPSLDISMRGRFDSKEDIFEDHGGAINNVISMGLRMIAVVKAGGTQFLALDEPECWVKPDRIPAFFGVLEDAARRLKIQTICITHHDASANFGPEVRITTLVGTAEQGARLQADRAEHPWTEDEPGFRYWRFENFQAFEDATFILGPGVNALVGPNDQGKSRVIRGTRAVLYGEADDSIIRHGAKRTVVEAGLAKGRLLRFSRELKRNPKNLWSLHEADGSIVVENGITHETGGSKPPQWLDDLLGIHKIEGLDVHLAHQKHPVFLLNQPATQRANVLAIGQEAGYTNDMLEIHKKWMSEAAALIKDGELRLGGIVAEIETMSVLDRISETIAYARDAAQAAREWRDYVTHCERVSTRLLTAASRLDEGRSKNLSYERLPSGEHLDMLRTHIDELSAAVRSASRLYVARRDLDAAKATGKILDDLPPSLPDVALPAEGTADRLDRIRSSLSAARQRHHAFASLPEAVPTVQVVDRSAFDRLDKVRTDLEAARKRRDSIAEQIAALKEELEEVLDSTEGHCPTCGHAASASDILDHHAHEVAS